MTVASLQLKEFLTLPWIEESPAWEYVEGEAIQKPMGGGKHSALQKRLVAAIDQAGSIYEAFPEMRCTFGDRSVVPDVIVVAKDQLPLDPEGEISSTGIEFAPPWVIEILSPVREALTKSTQSQTRVTGKILHCLKYGSHLGWLIDPQERLVLVYQPNRLPDLLAGEGILPVPEAIDLRLSVNEMFGWLRRSH